MAWKLSQEGINKFEELKKEHPDYAETIDAILRLDREGNPLLCEGCVYYEHVTLVYGPIVYLPFKSDKAVVTSNTTVAQMDL